MSEIVFILGAGASVDGGVPLMGDFLDRADDLRKSLKLVNFQDHFDVIHKVLAWLQQAHSKSDLRLENIESVFAAIEMGLLIDKLPELTPEERKILPDSMIKIIFRTIELYTQFRVRDRQVRYEGAYKNLVELIRNLQRQRKSVAIITFNYDIALDYALHFDGIPIDYSIPGPNKHHNSVPLLKLHGSINWANCPKCLEIIRLDFNTFFNQNHNLRDNEVFVLDIASRIKEFNLQHCDRQVNDLPFIVPPTWNKTKYRDLLRTIWQRAAKEISEAENIFISGFSLNDSDLFFRDFFAVGSISGTLIKKIWVYDPDEGGYAEARYEKLIGVGIRSRYRFIKIPFRDALTDIAKHII